MIVREIYVVIGECGGYDETFDIYCIAGFASRDDAESFAVRCQSTLEKAYAIYESVLETRTAGKRWKRHRDSTFGFSAEEIKERSVIIEESNAAWIKAIADSGLPILPAMSHNQCPVFWYKYHVTPCILNFEPTSA